MSIKKQYAVFDWDNTVRRGFTLFQWIDFLYEKKKISLNLLKQIDSLSSDYKSGKITHDQFAEKAWDDYVMEIKNYSKNMMESCIKQYMEIDKKEIYPFSRGVFDFLADHGIDIIIVSGAPHIILEQYRELFRIKTIYAVREECRNGMYTGKILYNAGYNKGIIMEKLKNIYGVPPLFGFGDSDSDIPILQLAEYGFQIVSSDTTTTIKLLDKEVKSLLNDVQAPVVIKELQVLMDEGACHLMK